MKRSEHLGVTEDVAAIRDGIARFFRQTAEDGVALYGYFGVYVFFDYDGEPIYVGQTREGLGSRVGRHMTNQRSDAVAMNVLDPFEVAYIEVYPLYHKSTKGLPSKDQIEKDLNGLEYTVFQKVLKDSELGEVLNEKIVSGTGLMALPRSYRTRIIPDELFEKRRHPDIRIARRANTIARLAQVISERSVSPGLRHTLLVQAQRLEKLARERFGDFEGELPTEALGEETGESMT